MRAGFHDAGIGCRWVWRGLLGALAVLLAACAERLPRPAGRFFPAPPAAVAATQTGIASLYWQGRRTASGERFNPNALTAAHRTWPFNSRVRVTNLNTGKSVIVRINDRGPFTRGRIIDITPPAAKAIGFDRRMGLARVRIELLR